MNKKFIAVGVAVILGLGLAACSETDGGAKQSARQNDEQKSAQGLVNLQQAQPTPNFDYSQIRQNLIEILTAQANTTQTTSFFFNVGVDKPIFSCPSIGYAIPATYQLTNPEQVVTDRGDRNGGNLSIPQSEVTGIYTADTTGTHVMCVSADGKIYDNYWEGFVNTVTGPAVWNDVTHQVELTGAPTASFTTK